MLSYQDKTAVKKTLSAIHFYLNDSSFENDYERIVSICHEINILSHIITPAYRGRMKIRYKFMLLKFWRNRMYYKTKIFLLKLLLMLPI